MDYRCYGMTDWRLHRAPTRPAGPWLAWCAAAGAALFLLWLLEG